jgi:hypothetical protein
MSNMSKNKGNEAIVIPQFRDLWEFVYHAPGISEPLTKKTVEKVKSLISAVNKVPDQVAGENEVNWKRVTAERKSTPIERKKRILEFIDSLTPSDMKEIGADRKSKITKMAELHLRTPAISIRLNAL